MSKTRAVIGTSGTMNCFNPTQTVIGTSGMNGITNYSKATLTGTNQ